jgi:hypothetical protein
MAGEGQSDAASRNSNLVPFRCAAFNEMETSGVSQITMASGPWVQLWSTAISTNASNGREIVFRFANVFRPAFDRASQPIRIIITWKYHSATGQPEREEHQQMIQFEDVLGPVLDRGGFATLALVSTGENLREWIYYAQSEGGFAARFDYAFAGRSAFPIEINSAHDPQWQTYEEFRAGVREGDCSSS